MARREFNRSIRGKAGIRVATAVFAAACVLALPADAGTDNTTVKLAGTGLNAERVKSIPIGRRSGDRPRSVMSLSPDKLGTVEVGDELRGLAEVEVSVTCLEPSRQCIGKIYDFNPHVKAAIVLGSSPGAAGDATVPITRWRKLRCVQKLPHRNHHCVITVAGGSFDISKAADAPCAPRCNVNLVLDAFHRRARPGHKLVVGSDSDNGRVEQDKGMLQAAIYHQGDPNVNADTSTRRFTKRLPIGGGGNGPRKVVYSRRIPNLQRDDQLIIEAQARGKISHLSYSVLLQSQLVLSERPGSLSRAGNPIIVTNNEGLLSAQNGFNCTQRRSGHTTPCAIRKVGISKLLLDSRQRPKHPGGDFGGDVPLYANLVVQGRRVGIAGGRHRGGDAVKFLRRGGFIKVTRYPARFARGN